MAYSAIGLQTHIWNNNIKSVILLLGFPFLLLCMIFAFFAFTGVDSTRNIDLMDAGLSGLSKYGAFAFLGAAVWFVISYFFHQRMINASTGASELSRIRNPQIYNLLENLCISRGITMPKLFVIDSYALNAYASGVSEHSYAITVTSGLMEALNEQEMEAVLAHELTHIRNSDVRLLIISVIFVGIISFACEMLYRNIFRFGAGRGGGKGNGVNTLIALAVLAVGYVFSIMIRFALSRKREYLADAGAVELTKNPSALISALRKISGNSNLQDAPEEVKQMFIENTAHFMGLFATHPPIEDRIAVLVGMGGHDIASPPQPEQSAGPWS